MDSKPEPILPYAIPATSGAAFLPPQDIEKLFAELESSRATIARQELEIQSLTRSKEALKAAELKIQALTLELAHHRRMRFGQSSEALAAAGQRELFEETLAADLAAIEAELEQAKQTLKPKPPRKPRARAGRQPLPAHLPRVEHRHEPESCACGQCGGELVKIGEDVSEQLDVEPAKFTVHRKQSAAPSVKVFPKPPSSAPFAEGRVSLQPIHWGIGFSFSPELPFLPAATAAARRSGWRARSGVFPGCP